MYGFLLSKENIELAKAEVEALTDKGRVDENLFLVECSKVDGLEKRLAYSNTILKILFECDKEKLLEEIDDFDLNKYYKNSFSVKAVGKGLSTKELADAVYRNINSPLVDLDNPGTSFVFIFTSKKAYCGIKVKDVEKGFESRKAHKRPRLHPVSLHPKLARCCVNLTGVNAGEKLLDPFCGTAGILIEAGLMGIRIVGYDIDEEMLERSKENLEFFSVKDYIIEKKDATKFKEKFDHVVTDLPYGKNTKSSDLKELYDKFIFNLGDKLMKKAVVIFPTDIDNWKTFFDKGKLKVIAEFEYYIHKSMSKRILVIVPR